MLKRAALVVALGLPCIIYCCIVFNYSLNIPILDDFLAVLHYLNLYSEFSFADKLKHIFAPYNEYKLLFSNIVQILIFELNGTIDFRYMVFIANFGLLLIFTLYVVSFRTMNTHTFYLLPLPFLFFNLSQYELSLWAMASMQAYYQMLFSLLGLYFLTSNKTKLANLFLVFSMFEGGLWIAVSVVYFLKYGLNKEYKNIVMTALIMACVLLFSFLTGIEGPKHNIFENIKDVTGVILFSLGSLGSVTAHLNFSIFVGFCIFLIVALIGYKNKKSGFDSFYFNASLMLIITSIALAINRIHTGVNSSISPRYSVLSIMVLVSTYALILEQIKNEKLKNYFFAVSTILAITVYSINLQSFYTMENKYSYANFYFSTPTQYKDLVEEILNTSEKNGVYSRIHSEGIPR